MKLLRIVLSILTVVLFGSYANAKTINMARANWDTGYFHAEIYKIGLEKLGYKIPKLKDVKPGVFYVAAAAGDIDLWVNGWVKTQATYIDATKGKVIPIGYVAKQGGLQGYLIDKKSAEKYNIKSVLDIKKHAKAFDANGDGKADMVACPPGWGCEKVITGHFNELGLDNFINPIKAEYSASLADAISRYKNGGSILYYTWAPNWIFGELKLGKDVVWIEVPSSNTKAVQSKHATKAKINHGFKLDDIRATANKEFLNKNPKVKKFLEAASIPLADISSQNLKMFKGEKSERDVRRHAEEWIKANQSTFDSWIKKAQN
tara:strand:+ start:201 stop:1154 length:954 start_codon:yes stop_codon:yes gene_type:complete